MATVATGAVVLVPVTGASAANTFDPGDFTVTMSGGTGYDKVAPVSTCSAGNQSTDLQSFLSNVAARWNGQGQAPSATCSTVQVSTFTNAALSGTVTNANVGQGTIEQTCDMRRTITSTYSLTVTAGAPNTVTVGGIQSSMDGYQACAWAMKFADAKSTKLSGTIEQTFGFSGTGRVECGGAVNPNDPNLMFCVEVRSDSKVWVVGGSGAYAGTGGTGTFSDVNTAPIIIPGTQGVKLQSMGADEVVRLVLPELPAAGSSDTAKSLKLSLLKSAKATVRIVSPTAQSGTRTLGVGANGNGLTTVKLSAAPGAKCGVTAKSGKTSKTVAAPKTDSDGLVATSVTAATLKSKLSLSAGAKVTLSVYCAVGKSTAKTDQSVTLGA
jgi:hypothetical protein